MSFTQLSPSIPVVATINNDGNFKSGEAIAVIDYSAEHNLIWVIAFNDTGEIWSLPNQNVRLQFNITMGRV